MPNSKIRLENVSPSIKSQIKWGGKQQWLEYDDYQDFNLFHVTALPSIYEFLNP